VQLSRLFGRDALLRLAEKRGLEIPRAVQRSMRWYRRKKFEDGFSWFTREMRDPDLIDLAKQLLALDMDDRITIEQALAHPFFTRAQSEDVAGE
jgi:serine/threonine protein kinase